MLPVPDEIKGRNPITAAGHGFTVDDAGPRTQLGECLDNQREAIGLPGRL
jgi:hypothetical protein